MPQPPQLCSTLSLQFARRLSSLHPLLANLVKVRLLSKLVSLLCCSRFEILCSIVSLFLIARFCLSCLIIFAFDEVMSLGHKENVNVAQIKQYREMESHEEKLHKLVMLSKINETNDVMKRKASEIDKSKVVQLHLPLLHQKVLE
ncbi:hypothetical protein RIF29_39859 [Crotalaria pallida]|uniref:Coatomer subunit delta n=1 Tax=Crotalaria pallida TaxID=3830 RepID=A0AAN9E1Z4_CROPI